MDRPGLLRASPVAASCSGHLLHWELQSLVNPVTAPPCNVRSTAQPLSEGRKWSLIELEAHLNLLECIRADKTNGNIVYHCSDWTTAKGHVVLVNSHQSLRHYAILIMIVITPNQAPTSNLRMSTPELHPPQEGNAWIYERPSPPCPTCSLPTLEDAIAAGTKKPEVKKTSPKKTVKFGVIVKAKKRYRTQM